MTTKPAKTYRSPRRDALAQLKAIKDRLQWCINQWTTESYVWETEPCTISDEYGTRESSRTVRRSRRSEEYPENSAQHWSTLHRQALEAAFEANRLAEFAAAEWRKCLERQPY